MNYMNNVFQIFAHYDPAGDQPTAIESLVNGLRNGLAHQVLLGVTGSGKTFTVAQVITQVKRPTLVMAPNKTLAAQLYGEFKTFFPNNRVEYFVSYYDYYQPEAYVVASDTFIEKDASINQHIEQMRLSATKTLLERKDAIIVATVSAIYGLGDPISYLSMVLHLARKDRITQRSLLKRLAEMQYSRNQTYLERGQFRVHGDIIDIFPADSEKDAIRIELFDGEVDNISRFDPLTGAKLQHLLQITIFPKTHYVTPRERILQTIELIKDELSVRMDELTANNKLLEAQRIHQRTMFDIEMMLELGYCSGIENYSRYLSGRQSDCPPPTLFDYLPNDALLIIDESHATIPQIRGMYRGDRSRKENLVQYGFRLPSALDNRPLRFEEFELKSPQTIYVSATPGEYELERAGNLTEQLVRPTGLIDPEIIIRPAGNQIDDLLVEITSVLLNKYRVLVTTLTKRMAEDLTEYLREHEIKVRYLHSDVETMERIAIIRSLRLGEFDVLVGINLLREGLDIPEVALVAILDADKEGFLRSERSLIQTIGRAARNIHGRAILYADRITGSMQRALDETIRRRTKQMEYNALHGIIPQSIQKSIVDIMENSTPIEPKMQNISAPIEPAITPAQLKQLEQQMHQHAHNMEFELAAKIRDQIIQSKSWN